MATERKRILIVDDVPDNIRILAEAMQDEYAVMAATSGAKALQLAAAEPRPDLVLLDVMMPEMDGYEVLRRLKHSGATSRIPVIFVTAVTEAEAEAGGLELGAVDYITKPVNPAIVRARVATHLQLASAREALRDTLRRTVNGSVRVMSDVLALANPTAFSHASRVRRLVRDMAAELGLPGLWRFELAAMFSQLGDVMLSDKTLAAYYAGESLGDRDARLVAMSPEFSSGLVANIPRLEEVAAMIDLRFETLGGGTASGSLLDEDPVAVGGHLVGLAHEFHLLEASGASAEAAIGDLRAREGRFDPRCIDALEKVLGAAALNYEVRTLPAVDIAPGMILDQDVHSDTHLLLASRGMEVSQQVYNVLQRFAAKEMAPGLFRVFVPKD